MLTVSDLVVHYGRLVAVRGTTFMVGDGEIVCLVGPNGAGKSTTLLAIAGTLRPSGGSIRLLGEDVCGFKPEQLASRGVSLVPENRHIFSSLTVRENLFVGASARRDRAAVRRDLDSVFEHFSVLRDRADGPAGKLSGGEQQQLAIARALMSRPRLLLVDEPTLGLSPRLVDVVYGILTDLRLRRRLTLLVVEQSTQRALQIADRLMVMRGGTIVLEGNASDLRNDARLAQEYFGV